MQVEIAMFGDKCMYSDTTCNMLVKSLFSEALIQFFENICLK